MARPRVLVADDSAFARKVVREVLSDDPRIEVVGYARDGLDALEQIAALAPDVVTLDLVMPELDGLGVLEAAMRAPSPPKFVLVTTIEGSSDLVLRALERGAIDFVHKPTSLATDRLYDLREELVAKVLTAYAASAPREPTASSAPFCGQPDLRGSAPPDVVVIGASTGGPRAIHEVLSALPAGFDLPVAVVLHMPDGYVEAFCDRLDKRAKITVRCATDGGAIARGTAVVGPAGSHLLVDRRGDGAAARLGPSDGGLHVPAIDTLFESAARAFGPRVLGIVLTGMGDDGTRGARAIRNAGGAVWTESAATCVVYGMPRAVVAAGASSAAVRLEEFAPALAAISAGRWRAPSGATQR